MTTSNEATVAALVASVLKLPVGAIGADAAIQAVPQWDSLAQLNICLAFQEKFGIAMNMEMIASATSVAKLAALIPGKS